MHKIQKLKRWLCYFYLMKDSLKADFTAWFEGVSTATKDAGAVATIIAFAFIFVPPLINYDTKISIIWFLTTALLALCISSISILASFQAYQKVREERELHKQEIIAINDEFNKKSFGLPNILNISGEVPLHINSDVKNSCLIITEAQDWLFKEGLVLIYHLKEGVEHIVGKGEVIHEQTDGKVQIFCSFLEQKHLDFFRSSKDSWDKLLIRRMSAKALDALNKKAGHT